MDRDQGPASCDPPGGVSHIRQPENQMMQVRPSGGSWGDTKLGLGETGAKRGVNVQVYRSEEEPDSEV